MRMIKPYTIEENGDIVEINYSVPPVQEGSLISVEHLISYSMGNRYLVIDSFNDSLEIIPDFTWDLIQHNQNALEDIERNYYFSRFFRDRRLLETYRHEAVHELEKKRPVNFVLCPTYSCNYSCAYCYQQGDRYLDKSVMSGENLEKIFHYLRIKVKRIRDVHPKKTVVIELFGGEALQNKTRQIIEKIFNFCREQKLVLFCTTNGAELISFLDIFAAYRGYVARVATTIDGGRICHDLMRRRKNGTGSFDDIVASMNNLLRFGIKIRVTINLGKNNLCQLDDFLCMAKENGWVDNPLVQLEIARIFDRYYSNKEESTFMESQLLEHLISVKSKFPSNIKFAFLKSGLSLAKKFGWTFNQNEIGRARFHYCWASSCAERIEYIDPKLNIYRCTCTTGKEQYKIGNLNLGDAFDLSPWSSCNSIDCEECWNCPLGGYCGGGCHVSRSIDKSRFCREERWSFDNLIKRLVIPKIQGGLSVLDMKS